MPIKFTRTVPILRIFDVEKAREFYIGWLGFKMDWEHEFESGLPKYMQISRGKLVLHLSEHHGDASPGSTVFVNMKGIEDFYREVIEKKYKYNRPGLEKTFYNAKCFQVHDPFGNRLRFNEYLDPSQR
jgi:catechol 2,3-dioxygenase-like lactoylglutathione lyase family enzyme